MIDKTSQGASPVTSPRTSAPGNVFSTVRTATNDRLQYTVQNHNSIQNSIAMGRATKPLPSVSNEQVATVTDFEPRAGRHMRQSMHLQVQNAPGPQVDTVIDAIQRYLNISPRREPTSDPKAEDSIVRHPQQILQRAQRWDDALPYQFSINGAKSYQLQPEFHRWGGTLSADVNEPGLTGIEAPATRAPQPGSRINLEEVFAAQATMRDLEANKSEPFSPIVTSGPPNITSDPYFSPVSAAQNAMGRMRELMDQPRIERVSVGASALTDRDTYDPAVAWQATQESIRERLAVDEPSIVQVGAPGYSDRAYNDPASAWENAINRSAQNLAQSDLLPIVTVGAEVFSDRAENHPSVAGQATVRKLAENLQTPDLLPIVTVGAAGYSERPTSDPATAWEATINVMSERLERSGPELPAISPVNWSERPDNDPAVAWKASLQRSHDNLGSSGISISDDYEAPTFASQRVIENLSAAESPEFLEVGAGNLLHSIHKKPEQAWISGTQAAINLLVEPGTSLGEARSGAQEQAYVRAMKIMRHQQDFMLATQAIGRMA
ncbi:hypothetical protein C4J81_08430 [Deltaproteobacteria bacterium Smac51]|nr:hypothetical protein C4J81_08430 [Deltaproteobacteria bacterium Smac51]